MCPVTLICITARSYWQCHQVVGDLLFQVKLLKQKADSCTVKTSAVLYSVFYIAPPAGLVVALVTPAQMSRVRAATEAILLYRPRRGDYQ